MKSMFALLVLALVVAAVTPAPAADRNMVREAQMRLADLGFFSGFEDGVLGPVTQSAVKTFQRQNHLPATGRLNMRTYDLLISMDDARGRHKAGAVMAMPMPLPGGGMPVINETWHFAGTRAIPVRFGSLQIDEEVMGALHRYSIKLNGHPFLLADNQPGGLRVSDVFHLNGEDALVVTAWRGEDNCKFKNYLIAIYASGADATRHEFESCAPTSDAREAHGAVFIRFAAAMNHDGFDSWDVWRYENDQLVRL